MWRSLFIGLVALALAEEVPHKSEISKRQSDRGNVLIYDSAPGHYLLQSPDGATQQNPVDYASQQELYVTNSRKPQQSSLPYSHQPSRRPQYVTQQQLLSYQRAAQLQPVQQPQEQQSYEGLLSLTKAGHGNFYKPAPRVQPTQPQPIQPEPQQVPVQYASPADTNTGSFEEELAQLVAANRAQEQKYNAANNAAAASVASRKPAPQQYLKEISRPTVRPVARPVARYQQQPAQYQHAIPQQATQPAQPLYRYVYQQEQPQHVQQSPQVAASQQQYEQAPKPHYIQPQEYVRQQPQPIQSRPPQDDTLIRQLLSNPQSASYIPKSLAPTISQPDAPSRSQIYVSQSTAYKKPTVQAYASHSARDNEEVKQQPLPLVRVPTQRNKPLTQEEFQNLLQLGGYTATLIPSNQNAAHQEYLLQPRYVQQPQRGAYAAEQSESAAYQLPQQPIKRRPQYSTSSAL